MAFKYSDGQVYESAFHFQYVNGFQPKREGIVEVIDIENRTAGEGKLIHSRRSPERRYGRKPGWCK